MRVAKKHLIRVIVIQIGRIFGLADRNVTATARILRSICKDGPVTSRMQITEMPKLGQISGEQAAALTGLAPCAMFCSRQIWLLAITIHA